MQDRRSLKNQHQEIDEYLKNLSDTEIMVEFSKLLTSMYPHLIKTHTHCFDTFDDITEDLFFNYVHSTFSSKYGVVIDKHETQKYGFILHCYRKINHIILRPKNFPFTYTDSNGQVITNDATKLEEKELVFILFGDTQNFLSGEIDEVDTQSVNFDFINFVIVDKRTGLNFRNQDSFWVNKDLVDFELVLEDFDKEEHEFYKADIYAD